jgi:C1A family cysteine protease
MYLAAACSANALCAAYAYDNPSVLGSRLFLYFNERSMEGTIQDDSGACLSDGVEALHTYGLCPETMWPYSDDQVTC